MPTHRLTTAALTLLFLSTPSFAAPPAISPADIATQIRNQGPRGPVLRWMQALYDGNATDIEAAFHFPNPDRKVFAEANWQAETADQRLRKALDEAFGPEDTSTTGVLSEYTNHLHHSDLGMPADALEQQKNAIIAADMREGTDSAMIAIGRPPHLLRMYLLKINGQWKIDYNSTFLPSQKPMLEKIIALKNYATDVDAVTADVKAKKLKTRDEAWKHYDPIWNAYLTVIQADKLSSAKPPATAPTTQPPAAPSAADNPIQVTHDPSPRGPLLNWTEGTYLGDKNLAESPFHFSNENSMAVANARIETRIAELHLSLALHEKFGKEPSPNPNTDPEPYKKYIAHSSLDLIRPVAAFNRKNIAAADLQQSGNTATLVTPYDTFYLIKIKNEWKIDFDKTQPETPTLTPDQLTAWKSWRENVEALAADIDTGKFKSREEAWTLYDSLPGNAQPLSGHLP